jgi:hypothetical protein
LSAGLELVRDFRSGWPDQNLSALKKLEKALDVWEVANGDERKVLRPILQDKGMRQLWDDCVRACVEAEI